MVSDVVNLHHYNQAAASVTSVQQAKSKWGGGGGGGGGGGAGPSPTAAQGRVGQPHAAATRFRWGSSEAQHPQQQAQPHFSNIAGSNIAGSNIAPSSGVFEADGWAAGEEWTGSPYSAHARGGAVQA